MIKGEPDILNWRKTPEEFEFTEKYNIPILKGLTLKPSANIQEVPFNLAYKVAKNERQNKIVHFFLANYLFERTWTQLYKTTSFLADFKALLSPDFSLYTDMPKNSLVAVSSVGCAKDKMAMKGFAKGYEKMIEVLEPKQILWYGKPLDCIEQSIHHFYIESVYEQRFKEFH